MDIADKITRMKEAQKNNDTEAAHGYADDILCETLNELGYYDLVLEYGKVDKWYA